MAAYRACTRIFPRSSLLTKSLETCGDRLLWKHLHTSFKACSKKDPFELFMSDKVQSLLQRITGQDPARVFSVFKAERSKPPQYKVLTDEELRQVNNQRPVVCRHMDGKLQWAEWDVVDRLSQVYAPVPGRQIYMPKVFEEQYLETYLKSEFCNYTYLLELACVQFDPDNEHFVRVTHRTYEHICENEKFDELRSTRFFGPMSFYFCWVNKVEPLLMDMIKRELISDGADLITLYNIVQNKPASMQSDDQLGVVKEFCQKSVVAPYREELNQVLQEYETSNQTNHRQHNT